MEYIRVSAKKLEDAIIEASIQLETTSDNIEYEVLEHGSSGFFGIGSKPAVIRARRKEEKKEFDELAEIKQMFETKPSIKEEVKPQKAERKDRSERPEKAAAPAENRQESPKKEEAKPEKKIEPKAEQKQKPEQKQRSEQKPEKSADRPPKKPKKDRPSKEKIVREKPAEKVTDKNVEKPEEIKKEETKRPELKPEDKEKAEKKAVEFLQQVFDAMQMKVEITAQYKDDALEVNMEGDEMGILIGKRGQTLDSLQYLVSLVVNKEKEGYIRVKLDTEDYRSRRKETLENLARNIAFKVKRTRKPVFLEPMNPYERRVIHSALQNDPYVTTHSEGEEPYRKVVVTLKK
ncbi:MAG: RNA-binding cell elongation regulator Jag/EloR [Lachnospiraceae bacterium]|nr:protein jag [Robinsoniella sp.]MDY3767518.1 RNA-binding cell elongation regulator Jag/EloR [Lachnospiraceae bacterium]